MKKLLNTTRRSSHVFKFDLKMKLSILFLLVTFFSLKANDSYSQRTKITLKLNNVSVGQLIDEIESTTEFQFVYKIEDVNLERIVSIKSNNDKIDKILNQIFGNTTTTFNLYDRRIYLVRRAETTISRPLKVDTTVPALQNVIKGTISDKDGAPLAGANILEKGTTNGTQADFDGNFSLAVEDENALLVVSYIGFKTTEIALNGQATLTIELIEDAAKLEEIVVVGYGTQRKGTLTASVSVLDGEKIKNIPVVDVSNTLSGRVAGVLAIQNSGEPGRDGTTFRIRGIGTTGNADALVIVDGVERELNSVNPSDIESMSILKDAASVAPYGMKGANGVVLITTKRGKSGELIFSYNPTFSTQKPIGLPELLNSYDWAKLRNVSLINSGQPIRYTEEELEKFKNGSDPLHYPNQSAIDQLVHSSPLTKHDLSITGGTENIKFYGSLGYLDQGSIWGNGVTNFQRYNYKSSVDVTVSENTTLSLDVSGNYKESQYPGTESTAGIITILFRQNPTLHVVFPNGNPAGYFGRSIYQSVNPESGYSKFNVYESFLTARLKQKIPFIPGLAIEGAVTVNRIDTNVKEWKLPYTYYALNAQDGYDEIMGNVASPTLSESFVEGRDIIGQLMATYNKSWGKHRLGTLLVFEPKISTGHEFGASRKNYELFIDELNMGSSDPANKDNSGTSWESKQVGYAYRASYNYDSKYMLETAGRYDGHYYFAPGKKFAFFPSASAAWRISEEAFFNSNIIDNLKLRASWGKSGALAGGPFQWLAAFNLTGSYLFGDTPRSAVTEGISPNPLITWEKAVKNDIGVELGMFDGLVDLELDVFYEKRDDMLIYPDVILPVEYGNSLAQENKGKMENKGIDLTLSSSKQFTNDFSMSAAFNFTYAKNKILEISENDVTKSNPNRSRTGRPLGTQFGLKSLGYYQSQAEIDNSPYATANNLQPGDVKYWDVNDDNEINGDDEVVIGNPRFPNTVFGLDLNFNYKRFSLNTLWQGAAGAHVNFISGRAAIPFYQNNGSATKAHLDYWTPDNPNATYPRIIPVPDNNQNNWRTSTHWLKKSDYLRLKTITLSYDFDTNINLLKKVGVNALKVYYTGQNLLTLSGLPAGMDPEKPISADYYWLQSINTLGIGISF